MGYDQVLDGICEAMNIAKTCGYTFEDIANRYADTIEDIEKAMAFRLGKGEDE